MIDKQNEITYPHFQMLDMPPVEPHQTFFQDSPWKIIRMKTLSTQRAGVAARYHGQQVCVPHQHMYSNNWAECHYMSTGLIFIIEAPSYFYKRPAARSYNNCRGATADRDLVWQERFSYLKTKYLLQLRSQDSGRVHM